MSAAFRSPQVVRVSILTLRTIEAAIAAGLDPVERERRSARLREPIAQLIEAAKRGAEPLP